MRISRWFGESIPDEGCVRVQHDDSVIEDTVTEKTQNVPSVASRM